MSQIIGDIAIKVGADIAPLVRDLSKAKGEMARFGNSAEGDGVSMAALGKGAAVAAAAVLSASVAMAAFTKAAMNNIDAMSKSARIAGVAVSEFQAMSLVAGEAGVST